MVCEVKIAVLRNVKISLNRRVFDLRAGTNSVPAEIGRALIESGHAVAVHSTDDHVGSKEIPLGFMRVPELKKMASEMGIEGAANMSKKQLIDAIEAAMGRNEQV